MQTIYFDVTSTLRLHFTSGVQRVTRELARRLCNSQPRELQFVPIVFCPGCDGWRQLSKNEHQRLTTSFPLPDNPGKTRSRWLPILRTAASMVLGKTVIRRLSAWNHPAGHDSLALNSLQPGSLFLDLDSAWHSPVDRSSLLPVLNAQGVSILTLHYDIIPLILPELVHTRTTQLFIRYFQAHVKHSDLFICISDHSRIELMNYCERNYPELKINSTRIDLGSDFIARDTGQGNWPLPPDIKRYILAVGTIEPRKNYDRLLDVFDAIGQDTENLSLVIVGRRGWKSRELIQRIHTHPWRGTRLFWLEGIDDQVLARLYRGATLCVIPSLYEGYGLPVSESLAYGCITLSSKEGALIEAGRGFAEYFDAQDTDGMITLIENYIKDPLKYANKRSELRNYQPISWDETAKQLVEIIKNQLRRSAKQATAGKIE